LNKESICTKSDESDGHAIDNFLIENGNGNAIVVPSLFLKLHFLPYDPPSLRSLWTPDSSSVPWFVRRRVESSHWEREANRSAEY